MHVSVASLERPINLEIKHHPGHRSGGGRDRDDEAREAQHLQADPPRAPPLYLLLRDVHLHREVNRERPEPESPEDPDDVVEEGQQHRDQGGEQHKHRPPYQPEHVESVGFLRAGDLDPDVPVDESAVRELCTRGFLDEGEEGLAVNLVSSDQMDDNGGVGYVEEPKGVVEAEAGEEIARCEVSERRVSHAPA